MALIQIAKNAVVAKIINPSNQVVNFVNNILSYDVDNPGMSGWSGKSSFFDVNSFSFPAGFVNVVQDELSRAGHTVQIISKPNISPAGSPEPIVDSFGNDDPRYDYQMKTLRQVEKYGAGIVRVATGGGKSKIAKLIIQRYKKMTLFLTTRGILLYQMKDQLDDLGTPTGVIGDGEMSISKGVNLGMVQTLVQAIEEPFLDAEIRTIVRSIHTSKKKKNENLDREEIVRQATLVFERKSLRRDRILKFLSLIEVVIGEEAHEVGGDSYYQILKYCKNATIRIALTATPFMRTSASDNMRLMAAFGPVLIDVSEDLLIKRGILAKPYFKFVDVAPSPKLHKTSPFERAYELGYTSNENMHAEILRDARKAAARALPVLTLVSRKKHGEELLRVLTDAGLKFVFLKGEDDMVGRRRALDMLASGEIHGIIGTTILDVGVDVPAIGLIQLAGGMKAQVALRQRIGRGLRAKKNGPNVAFIADYSCNMNNYLKDHAKQREGIIRSIEGFREGILTNDLDWSMFPII